MNEREGRGVMRWGMLTLLGLVLYAACKPTAPEAVDLSGPSSLTSGEVGHYRIVATQADGTVGTGTVKLSSSAGSLTTAQTLTLDAFGTATADFTCSVVDDPDCTGRVTLTATWRSATTDLSVKVGDTSGAGGGAGTGGAGGGGQQSVINAMCSASALSAARYGLGPVCCGTGFAKVPCGTIVLSDGDTFDLRIQQGDGGIVTLAATAVAPPFNGTTCSATKFGIKVDNFPPGVELAGTMATGVISSGGVWTETFNQSVLGASVVPLRNLMVNSCDSWDQSTTAGFYLQFVGLGVYISVAQTQSNWRTVNWPYSYLFVMKK